MPRGTSLYDTARHQGRLWTPKAIQSDLLYWTDASDLSTLTLDSSSLVSAIRDKGPRGASAVQATAARRPLYRPVVGAFAAGRPSILHAGNEWLEADLGATYTGTTLVAYVAGTCRGSTLSAFGRLISAVATSGQQDHSILTNFDIECPSSTNPQLSRNSDFSQLLTNALSIFDDQPIIAEAIFTGSNMYLSVNGAMTAGAAQSAAFGFRYIRHGHYTAGSTGNGWGGCINEVIFDSAPYSVARRQKIEGYLAWKWGVQNNVFQADKVLQATHPFKNRPPLIGD